jgi:hypothetical protein
MRVCGICVRFHVPQSPPQLAARGQPVPSKTLFGGRLAQLDVTLRLPQPCLGTPPSLALGPAECCPLDEASPPVLRAPLSLLTYAPRAPNRYQHDNMVRGCPHGHRGGRGVVQTQARRRGSGREQKCTRGSTTLFTAKRQVAKKQSQIRCACTSARLSAALTVNARALTARLRSLASCSLLRISRSSCSSASSSRVRSSNSVP